MKRLLSSLVALSFVAACESSTTAPVAASSSASLYRGNGAIVHQVSAGGADWVGPGVDANWSLTAFQLADGSVRGQWSDQFGHGNGGVHMTVTCLHVVGNEAWITGVADNGEFAGRVWMSRMKDNGNSANDPADQISYSWLQPVGSQGNCHTMPQFPLFYRTAGQVTIR